jgi:hypothetical protein
MRIVTVYAVGVCLLAILACACADYPRLPSRPMRGTRSRLVVRQVSVSQAPQDNPSIPPRKIRAQPMITANVDKAGRDKTRSIADDVPAGELFSPDTASHALVRCFNALLCVHKLFHPSYCACPNVTV